ncbi:MULTISPECIES: NAD(P)/FAD-dependent oxidoreductase [Thioalkalivibrio]|uniref:Aminoacetone oxidase family FAD-binding enzyme n=1 Tax=Thioalkalivibrio halophilus TaxID=252474 RepID=A0A1V3A0M3_9GAMM|nr:MULTISPECIES: NAD(P)/FAD-dependent oxidoreductase [Thioalkalivibrio]OOC10907.1 hypothetical protein B1A74_03520 [Thioalkalivibrio halophilus]
MNESTEIFDVAVIGAGAAGMMCAAVAGARGRRVVLLDHADRAGKKILMSGGGRCNFTNMECGPDNFLSANPHFVKSALARYTPWDFVALVAAHGIPYHEKKLGQLFCDHSSKDIVRMLLDECAAAGVTLRTSTPVEVVSDQAPWRLRTPSAVIEAESLVIATGGYPIPRMGATGFGLDLAQRLDIPLEPTRPALVPLTLDGDARAAVEALSGIALDAVAEAGDAGFRENVLFTHRGVSGPAILQVSSYWQPGQSVTVDFFPGESLEQGLRAAREETPKRQLRRVLGEWLTRRVARHWLDPEVAERPLERFSDADLAALAGRLQPWVFTPSGTEGYARAEVMAGGVDTRALSSRTCEAKGYPGLYFIGEVVDVTGHLGGHNFQWAWASGHAAGEVA